MSQDLPIPRQDNRSDGTAVVEWGTTESASPRRVGSSLAGLGRDRRLPLVLTGLGAVAAVASLVGEWLVMTMPNGGPEGSTTIRVPGGVGDVGSFGVGYLIGLLGLAAAVALALYGTRAVRHNARVAGLALAATVLTLLAGTAFSLGDSNRRTLFYSPENGFQVEYGRGLVVAFVATALFAAALHLAGRADVAPGAGGGAADEDAGRERPGRGWRRRASVADDGPPAPADLTVQPTVPFARPEPPA